MEFRNRGPIIFYLFSLILDGRGAYTGLYFIYILPNVSSFLSITSHLILRPPGQCFDLVQAQAVEWRYYPVAGYCEKKVRLNLPKLIILRIFLKFGMEFRHQNWRSIARSYFLFSISKGFFWALWKILSNICFHFFLVPSLRPMVLI